MASHNMVLHHAGCECDLAKIETTAALVGIKLKKVLSTAGDCCHPKLETPAGDIYCCPAMMRHLARCRPDAELYGRTLIEAAQVDTNMDAVFVHLEMPMTSCDNGCNEEKKKEVQMALTHFNEKLATKTFLVGERLSIADIALAAVVLTAGCSKVEAMIDTELPHLKRFLNTMKALPQWTGTKKCPGPGAGPCCKKAGGATCGATAAAAPAAASAADKVDDEKPAPKEKNPLDSLPPSPLIMDEWKRVYSNTKDLYGTAMPWLWEHFDKEGYCFFFMKYDKLEDECKVDFVSSNQLKGFLQVFDPAFRKYSFGVHNVVGEPGNFDIQGVWMFRGQDLPQEVKDHRSYEYHKFRCARASY
eukprot:GHVU01010264.1.p1 GENE.GHVU01010264.1~~GHVU01010264.1.p1  ORF type:complete len:359 (+),score=84.25 GHVU01010264.1:598-1674(+)